MAPIGLLLAKIVKSALMGIVTKLLTETVAAKVVTDLFLDVLKLLKKKDLLKGTDIDDHVIDNLIQALEKK